MTPMTSSPQRFYMSKYLPDGLASFMFHVRGEHGLVSIQYMSPQVGNPMGLNPMSHYVALSDETVTSIRSYNKDLQVIELMTPMRVGFVCARVHSLMIEDARSVWRALVSDGWVPDASSEHSEHS